ncbi:MAG: DUF2911 domain-containing protein [Ferruginibacter sp.]
MKHFVPACILSFFSLTICMAQQNIPPLDKSPMDESYCPNNFPLLKIQDKISDPLLARVIYSRPQKSGRAIFGDLIEYGKVWRLGANEATEIEFYQHVKLGDTKIKKGRYTLYAIPDTANWTIILNKDADTWGSFKYDMKKDVVRLIAPVQKQTEIAETFTISFDKSDKDYNLQFYWDDIKVAVPVSISL